jgi:hypothetical protein
MIMYVELERKLSLPVPRLITVSDFASRNSGKP